MKLIDRIKQHRAFKEIHDEGEDFDSKHNYWLNLKDEYIDDESGCGSIHEYTLKEVWDKLKNNVVRVDELSLERQKFHGESIKYALEVCKKLRVKNG